METNQPQKKYFVEAKETISVKALDLVR